MLNQRVSHSLKEAQSKSKQKEFGIDKVDYPTYTTDSTDLDYYCVYQLSEISISICNNSYDSKSQDSLLDLCSKYFDSALTIDNVYNHDNEYALLGATSFFLLRNFGSSKVLASRLNNIETLSESQRILAYTFCRLHSLKMDNRVRFSYDKKTFKERLNEFVYEGTGFDELLLSVKEYEDYSFRNGDPIGSLYYNLLQAVLIVSKDYQALNVLEKCSGIGKRKWQAQLKSIPSILWPSQVEIGEHGGYSGSNLLIQSPTGSGKTKSISLMIASAMLRGAKRIVVVSPLRALCDEISTELTGAFDSDSVKINRLSDVLEDDDLFDTTQNNVIVLTPEKLDYISMHNEGFLESIDMYVFDESHIIDDSSRGAGFELLLTSLKNEYIEKQFVFISAVASNINQIGDWMFGDKTYNYVSNSNLRTSEKRVAIQSRKNTRLDFYRLSKLDECEFYVAKSVKKSQLLTPKGKISKKQFPESTTKDLSIYYSNLLCVNGAVAVYFDTVRNIRFYLKRLLDLSIGGVDFNHLSMDDAEERERLLNLTRIHYGEGLFYKCAELGVMIHYADLEEGVKKTTEKYIRSGKSKVVFCTSTLSEGVNIPIRYLIMTSIKSYTHSIKTRELINLVGRTARNGIYTEGTVVCSNPNEKGSEVKVALDEKDSEPCKSVFEYLVNDSYLVAYNNVSWNGVYEEIIKCITEKHDIDQLGKEWLENYNARFSDKEFHSRGYYDYLEIYNSIRSAYLALQMKAINYLFSNTNPTTNGFIEFMKDTYGYYLFDNERKERLLNVSSLMFQVCIDQYDNLKTKRIPYASLSVISSFSKWIDENYVSIDDESIESFTRKFVAFRLNAKEDDISLANRIVIFENWVAGNTLNEISNITGEDIFKVEKFCRNYLSFVLAADMGNLIDLLSNSVPDDISTYLTVFQKRIKYGLSCKETIFLYENGLTDRYISERVVELKKTSESAVIEFLSTMPSWFSSVFKGISFDGKGANS